MPSPLKRGGQFGNGFPTAHVSEGDRRVAADLDMPVIQQGKESIARLKGPQIDSRFRRSGRVGSTKGLSS